MPRLKSNSFDYEPVRVFREFSHSATECSARDIGVHRSGSSRLVIVRLAERTLLCGTATRDFNDTEIRDCVHARGQLYLDVSQKIQWTNFASHLQQFIISPVCGDCADFPTCCGAFEACTTSFFLDDEMWIRRHLAGLGGRVLDVGMGQLPYLDVIEPAIRAGTLLYHGLDPDQRVVDDARARQLPIELTCNRIETFEGNGARFNHIVAIRCLNHFEDLHRALDRMCALLLEGGTLLLIESLPLPLVRPRRMAKRSHLEADGGFQHYQNLGSEDVIGAIYGRHPLEIAWHRPVGRDTCDQWILLATRSSRRECSDG